LWPGEAEEDALIPAEAEAEAVLLPTQDWLSLRDQHIQLRLVPEAMDQLRVEMPEETEKTRYLAQLLLPGEEVEALTTVPGKTEVQAEAEERQKDQHLLQDRDMTEAIVTAVQVTMMEGEEEAAQEEQAAMAVSVLAAVAVLVLLLLLQAHLLIMLAAEEEEDIMAVLVPAAQVEEELEEQEILGTGQLAQTAWVAEAAVVLVHMLAGAAQA
jgi:hypothetical protein